jgi:hypothetical protein
MSKGKTAFAIALFLMITVATPIMSVPNANALDLQMYLLIVVNPSPVGVGQTVYVSAFFTHTMPTSTGFWGDRHENVTVEVTKPDGNKQTFGPYMADSTGGVWFEYVPAVIGNYTFSSVLPRTNINRH